jgi:hypothetical protein
MKNAVFWDVAPCIYFVNRRFAGTYRLHLKGIRNPRAMKRRLTEYLHGATSQKTAFLKVMCARCILEVDIKMDLETQVTRMWMIFHWLRMEFSHYIFVAWQRIIRFHIKKLRGLSPQANYTDLLSDRRSGFI